MQWQPTTRCSARTRTLNPLSALSGTPVYHPDTLDMRTVQRLCLPSPTLPTSEFSSFLLSLKENAKLTWFYWYT